MKKVIPILLFIATFTSIAGWMLLRQPEIVPSAISKQLNFTAYVPRKTFKIVPNTINFNPGSKVLSMTVQGEGFTIKLNQQATPEVFSDVPEYYPKLLEKLRKDHTLSTIYGEVFITNPVELKDKQTAVLNSKGVLFFAEPSKNLDDTTWRAFFNSLEPVK